MDCSVGSSVNSPPVTLGSQVTPKDDSGGSFLTCSSVSGRTGCGADILGVPVLLGGLDTFRLLDAIGNVPFEICGLAGVGFSAGCLPPCTFLMTAS